MRLGHRHTAAGFGTAPTRFSAGTAEGMMLARRSSFLGTQVYTDVPTVWTSDSSTPPIADRCHHNLDTVEFSAALP